MILMKPRNLYLNNLFNTINNENLSLDERNRQAKEIIEVIVTTKLTYENFNPELNINQENEISLDTINEHGETLLTLAAKKGHAYLKRLGDRTSSERPWMACLKRGNN